MDFHLKQWREQQHESDTDLQSSAAAKFPRQLLLDSYHQHQQSSEASAVLPLFTPEPTTKLTTTNLSADSTTTRSSRMGGSCYFSMAQWQELELQALIFRHMLAGATVPPELLHLLKKSLILTSPSSPYYMAHPLQHYSHYQPALLQSGCWGRGAMDPEPGRCRRTDGKKWRCSRDVVGGHKYCERHMHRGRNRSRKPVEIPTPTATSTAGANNNSNGVGVLMKTNTNPPPIAAQPLTAVGGAAMGGGGGTNFGLSGPPHSFDLLHFNQSRPSESITETKGLFRTHNNELSEEDKSGGGRILRHFFDDWPRSVQEPENTINNASPGTSLSISVPGNPSSDFSLKLSTGGNRDDPGPEEGGHVEGERAHLNWGAPSGWGTNQLGGPLAEALRSSTSTSSPTSVLHQLRGEASFIST